MPLLTSASLEMVENPNSLVFRIERERGWLERAIAAAIILLFLWEAQTHHSGIWLIFALVAIACSFADWLQGTETEITVTSTEIAARGNVNRMFCDRSSDRSHQSAIDRLFGGRRGCSLGSLCGSQMHRCKYFRGTDKSNRR